MISNAGREVSLIYYNEKHVLILKLIISSSGMGVHRKNKEHPCHAVHVGAEVDNNSEETT